MFIFQGTQRKQGHSLWRGLFQWKNDCDGALSTRQHEGHCSLEQTDTCFSDCSIFTDTGKCWLLSSELPSTRSQRLSPWPKSTQGPLCGPGPDLRLSPWPVQVSFNKNSAGSLAKIPQPSHLISPSSTTWVSDHWPAISKKPVETVQQKRPSLHVPS